ncbi:MAG: hypothetical protein WAW13_00930 [Minisyncoccia bacterium]
MNFRNNFLLYTLALLFILMVSASYFRFLVMHDYVVAYEGTCDPATNNCFIGCTDDECTENYYYSKVQKAAPDVFVQCGDDITDCEDANVCLSEGDTQCSITYCDLETDGDACEILTDEEIDALNDDSLLESTTETLQDEIVNNPEL